MTTFAVLNRGVKEMENTKMWFEVFRTNEDESTETIFADESLELCVKVYRREKKRDKSVKVDKWMNAPYLDFPISFKSILN
jgi:hypothetical protein